MEIYTDANSALEIIAIANSFNIDAQVIGYCQSFEGKKLTIQSQYGTFEY
jgi:phosphoribosylformylglycinamidine cyclo-ligase